MWILRIQGVTIFAVCSIRAVVFSAVIVEGVNHVVPWFLFIVFGLILFYVVVTLVVKGLRVMISHHSCWRWTERVIVRVGRIINGIVVGEGVHG